MKAILKIFLFVSLFASLSAVAFPQDSASDKFEKGSSLFSSGDFNGALNAWMDLYNSGYRSAELAYNLGNAYFKLNNTPAAILFYERAYLLDPADEDINYNLAIARTLIVDRFQEIPELFFVRWFDFISLVMHSNAWAVISLVSFMFCLALLSLYIYSSRYSYKVTGFWLAVAFFVLSLTSLSFAARNKSLVYDSKDAIIFTPVVNGKSSPDPSGTDLFILHEGTKVSIEDQVGEWYEVRLSDGNKGWIPVNTLNII